MLSTLHSGPLSAGMLVYLSKQVSVEQGTLCLNLNLGTPASIPEECSESYSIIGSDDPQGSNLPDCKPGGGWARVDIGTSATFRRVVSCRELLVWRQPMTAGHYVQGQKCICLSTRTVIACRGVLIYYVMSLYRPADHHPYHHLLCTSRSLTRK